VDPLEGFEAELAARGLRHAVDVSSGRCVIWVHGARLMVSLDNLARQLTGTEHDREQISWFTDQVLAAAQPASLTAEGLSWCLEPSHYQESAEYRAAVSPRLDRVLVHADAAGAPIHWITPRHLSELGLSAEAAAQRAWANLDAALRQAAQLTNPAPGGVTLLSFASGVPSKASLLLAPSLREAISDVAGWPVLAVAPDRDFVYIWNASHRELISRLGGVVTREHGRAPYPLSTEVLHISDTIHAIGSYQA
jgi:hypothetical protein